MRQVTIKTPRDPADTKTKVEVSTDGTDVFLIVEADPDPNLPQAARSVKLTAATLRTTIEALEDMETLAATSAAPKPTARQTSWMPKLPSSWTHIPTQPKSPAKKDPTPPPSAPASPRRASREPYVGWDPYDVGDTL